MRERRVCVTVQPSAADNSVCKVYNQASSFTVSSGAQKKDFLPASLAAFLKEEENGKRLVCSSSRLKKRLERS